MRFLLYFIVMVLFSRTAEPQSPPFVQFETCNDAATLAEVSTEDLTSPKLMFSSSYLPCDDQNFRGPFALNCTGTYTRYSFTLPVRTTQQANGVPALSIPITALGTRSSSCLNSKDQCNTQGCRHIGTLDFTIWHTRMFMKYQLRKVARQAPFSFLPINGDGWGASSGCSSANVSAATCTGERVGGNDVCDPSEITQSYPGDFSNLNAVLDSNCGSSRDPTNGPIDGESCTTVCCRSCGSRTNDTYHRNWMVGPVCSVYQINPNPSYVAGIFVRMFGQVVNLPQTISVATLDPSPQQTRIGTQGKIRMYVNGMLLPTLQSMYSVGGYVVACNYENEYGNVDQGRFNPYVQRAPWFQNILDNPDNITLAELVSNAPFGTPEGANPITYYGAGKVPTKNSLNGTISWFYVSQPVISTVGPGMTPYSVRSQSELIQMSQSACATTSNVYYSNYTGVPGWDTDDAGNPLQTSVCQMSDALNRFASLFEMYIANGTSPADAAALIQPMMPPWLPPMYTIDRPNVWLHDGSMIVDISTLMESKAALNLFVDVSDEYVSLNEVQDAYSINSAMSRCKINSELDAVTLTGQVSVVAEALGGIEGGGTLIATARCYSTNGTELVVVPTSRTIVVTPGQSDIIISEPFAYNSTTALLSPSATGYCTLSLNYPSSVLDGRLVDSKTVTCTYIIRADLVANVRNGANPNDPAQFEPDKSKSDDDGSSSLGTGSIIGISVILGVAVLIVVSITIAGATYTATKSKRVDSRAPSKTRRKQAE